MAGWLGIGTKNLIASQDGKHLYVTVGSNSNVGERGMENEERRAAILEIDAATGATRVFASGLRNPNGLPFIGAIAFHPDGASTSYRKHFLQPGEDAFAAPGSARSTHRSRRRGHRAIMPSTATGPSRPTCVTGPSRRRKTGRTLNSSSTL